MHQKVTGKSPDNSSNSRAKKLAFWIGWVRRSPPGVRPEKGGECKDLRIELVLGAIRPQIILKFQTDSCRTILYLWRNHQFPEVSGNNRRDNFRIHCSTIFRPRHLCKLGSRCICGTPSCSTSGAMAWDNRLFLCTPSGCRVSNPGNGSWYELWFRGGGPIRDDRADGRSTERLLWCGSHSGLRESEPPQHPTHHISGATAWNFHSSEHSNYCFSKKYICSTNAQHVLWI